MILKMKYIKVEPEVIVGMGEHTVIDNSIYPPKVQNLHINLEDWMGDNLMENFPVYIITERLKKGLQATDFKGFKINNLELTTDEYFFEHYQLKKEIPKFYWLLAKRIRMIYI